MNQALKYKTSSRTETSTPPEVEPAETHPNPQEGDWEVAEPDLDENPQEVLGGVVEDWEQDIRTQRARTVDTLLLIFGIVFAFLLVATGTRGVIDGSVTFADVYDRVAYVLLGYLGARFTNGKPHHPPPGRAPPWP